MKKFNLLRSALVVVAVIMLIHYLFLTRFLPDTVNTVIEIVLSAVEIILIYSYVRFIRNQRK
ncbi:hypothetical protein MOO44_04495 [Nicoliella spurrieriana]|uniref:Uncharacterized protein n=1 Tax=Nicoliella spurrieriana TaxID=2925830 RepID=A0A976RT86_9LACO|nr:hypothetical protein [Nicoliella spurrieriana]UQS87417.1 hypothetical protein MOO44_04495 [Nicoliella spurrieriana]